MDDASIEVMVTVVDVRSAEGKPQILKGSGNPMDAIERAYNAEHGIKPTKPAKPTKKK